MIAELVVSLWFFATSSGPKYGSMPYASQVQCETARSEFQYPTTACYQTFRWVTYDSGKQP